MAGAGVNIILGRGRLVPPVLVPPLLLHHPLRVPLPLRQAGFGGASRLKGGERAS